jgi:hypothetical protein
MYVCKTWFLALRKEHRSSVSENRTVMEKIWTYEGGRGRRLGNGEDFIMRSFITFTLHEI